MSQIDKLSKMVAKDLAKELVDIYSIDFGTNINETFEQYITRVESEIDRWINARGGLSEGLAYVIIGIFKDIVGNVNGVKFEQIYQLLKRNLKREPMTDDLNNLIKLVEYRIMSRTKKYLDDNNDRSRTNRIA